MNFLITGGLGFIGSNFIKFILKEDTNAEIYNLDVMTYAGNHENLKDIENNPRYHFIAGNICNFELVDFILKNFKITHIINFAAESHVDRSISNPDIFIETNIKGTLTLLNAAKKNRYTVIKPACISFRYFRIAIAVVAHAIVADNTNRSPNEPRLSVKRFSSVFVVTKAPESSINKIP